MKGDKKTQKIKPPMDGAEGKSVRAYFLRLFGKYDLRNERQFVFLGKWLIFIVLLVVELSAILRHFDGFAQNGGWGTFFMLVIVAGVLTISQGLKLFVIKQNKNRIALYVLDALLACWFMFLTKGTYPISICMLILTEFYLTTENAKPSFILCLISALLYAGLDVVQEALLIEGQVQWLSLSTRSFGAVFALFVHFVVMQVALAFYRQFLRLDKALKELDESKRELEKAYEAVAEVTALEERQRIAKEIHDTAGHSITTVIMQTEAAKRIVEDNPQEAKGKIVAANLQAKHALEELRDSVHLLSGVCENETLKTALENIVHESTDGTGINIRSEIQEISVSPAKFRFICNTLKEGISNALRHGGATAFWFELKQQENQIVFLLSDNGKGADKTRLNVGFGLSTTMARAKALGGEVTLETELGEGFDLRLILPTDSVEE